MTFISPSSLAYLGKFIIPIDSHFSEGWLNHQAVSEQSLSKVSPEESPANVHRLSLLHLYPVVPTWTLGVVNYKVTNWSVILLDMDYNYFSPI